MTNLLEQIVAGIWNRLRGRGRGARHEGGSLNLGHRVVDERVTRHSVTLTSRERMRHVVVLGKTGSGKSYLLLVMVQAISLEQLGNGIWRGILLLVTVLVGICALKSLLLPILTSWLVALKQITLWAFVIVITVIAALLVLKILITKFANLLSARTGHNKEDS